jgi:HAD superfamily hydrolase (TIGR01509 family)
MTTNGLPKEVEILLFDVGGVLVQLSGVETMLKWMGQDATSDQLWSRWLKSAAVRKFETGQIDEIEFSREITAEFRLCVDPQEFLRSFVEWPTGLYPGTLEMLARIPRSYRRALLSNSNSLHWPRVLNEMNLGSAFDSHFVSHLTGRIKPDAGAFLHVVESIGCVPANVLFLDDNKINVEAARNIGMQAVHVQGTAQVQSALTELKILPKMSA